ncbi:hypothetical protein Desdi_0178 [Desulfitobacterium dichloroeliminans LMG P-21439]|uniref:YqzL-like protein n=1 Tax=Desulfitobacterium dichloroeliminans (strain LMG P-21439 / DCA1) TaxID=871963 RepID=L0F3I3_DESDL|nr:hypothetical protein Desdi_0178 [Desulfitobacterium dichloroeliminans LMG P-21439]
MFPAEWFWKIFEATGSPNAYLLYKQYAIFNIQSIKKMQ